MGPSDLYFGISRVSDFDDLPGDGAANQKA